MGRWVKKDLQFIWHPYTQMKDAKRMPPILIERAKGLKLYDEGGNFYYDTIASWWCNVFGHNHPRIKKAIKSQLDKLEHTLFAGFTHKPAIMLAEKIIALSPSSLKKVFFSDNGSTAVEVALKMSFQYWHNIGKFEKRAFLCLEYAYHGDTLGAMSVSGVSLFNNVFSPLFFKTYRVKAPYCYRCPEAKTYPQCEVACISYVEKILSKFNDNIAGVIIEPLVLAAGGMLVYPKEYLKRLYALTKKYNVHLILDEVATGLGRTAKMFAADYIKGLTPDFMCISKGITAGYLPLGLTLTTDRVYQAFYADYEKDKTFYHGHTYTANPLACRAAVATLEIFEEEDVLDNLKEKVKFFHRELAAFKNWDYVGDVRYLGMIGAIELVKDKKRKIGFKSRVGLEVYKEGLKNNLILRPLGNIIYFFLPLSTTKEEIADILKRTGRVLKKIRKKFKIYS